MLNQEKNQEGKILKRKIMEKTKNTNLKKNHKP